MKKKTKLLILLPMILLCALLGTHLYTVLFTPNAADSVAGSVVLLPEDAVSPLAPTENSPETPEGTPFPEKDGNPSPADHDGSPSLTEDTLTAERDLDSDTDLIPSEDTRPSVTLMAVGDNLMHMGVVYSGKQPDGSLDYQFLYQNLSPFLEQAAIRIINQETILGGNQLGFSGFPAFNSPTETGDSIAAAGFNVVLHASNHSADQNIAGIDSCVSFWKQHPEVLMIGIHEAYSEDTTPEERIPLLTVGDYTFAVLNYTYGPNMGMLPSALQGRLDELCSWNAKTGAIDFTTLSPQVLEDIALAKQLADAVIVCPHWGTEYSTVPSRYQKEFAEQMTAAGADLIIGTHPHVVQPVEEITAENGNTSFCFYSLGNYVSTQKDPICMLEAMAWVTFEPSEQGLAVNPERSGAVPLVCHYTSGPVRIENIYLLEEYTEEQCAAHGIRNYGNAPLKYNELLNWSEEILGDYVISSQQIFEDADT